MFNRVPADDRADENQAESAHKVPKMTLTMAELADELHISLPTARKLVRKSGFPAFSIGSRILINREGLQRDRKSTRLNSSHREKSRMPSSA